MARLEKLSLALQALTSRHTNSLTQVDYEPGEEVHFRIMRSIYQDLTEATAGAGAGPRPCPRTGPHWEAIGFQGLDPRTDVNRAMKMLAVLQVRPCLAPI